jgi:steroid 5-alpha reductase family enzyme
VVWGARLSLYLYATRVHGGAPEEGRYRQLREEWGSGFAGRLFWFFQAQGALDVLFAVPLLLVAWDPAAGQSPLAWAALGLWLVAFIGEGLADWQLHRFKADPAHAGQVCRAGLWAYSRHPNYFFELLVWVAFALVATPSPWGWLAWIGPAAMAFFLFRVTGIPATEAQALRSKGDAYRAYQRTTSAFVPWFRRAG